MLHVTPGAISRHIRTLEQGNMAAISGHGISVGDLLLSLNALRDGLLALPFPQAVATGDGYYFVWPGNAPFSAARDTLLSWLRDHLPTLPLPTLMD